MKSSKKQVEQSVLFFAKTYEQESNYKSMMQFGSTLPKIVEMIVYEMFLRKFNSYYCTEQEYEQYKILFEYSTELKQNGWVEFE